MTVEGRTPGTFAGSEIETLYRLCENAASALEVLYMHNLVREYVSIDRMTGLMSRKHFLRKVEDEVTRAEDFGSELALVSIAVDSMQEHVARYGRDGADAILNEIACVVRGNLRRYDAVGAIDDRIGVLLMETTASDAYLWAEKLRKMVAGHVISVAQKTLSVTLSVGVCGLNEGCGPTSSSPGRPMSSNGRWSAGETWSALSSVPCRV